MATTEEIRALEERLRLAELGPDASTFEELLDDDVVIDGERAKPRVVEAHRPTGTAKFTRVGVRDQRIVDHGVAAVVTCTFDYEGPKFTGALGFVRVWVKKPQGWRVVAASLAKK
jgi:hypothetical protein